MINWGLAQGNGFQNALATGMQMGAQAREAADRREYRNALAQYDPNNPDTLKAVMQVDPRTGMQLQNQQAQAQQHQAQMQAQQQQQRKADLPMLGKLLNFASQGPDQWQQAIGVAQQYGIDISGIPQQFDPDWAKSQATVIGALSTPEGQEALSTAGKQAVDMGFRPGTPEFQAKVTEIWQQNGAIPYTDAQGATRLYVPGKSAQAGPESGSVVGGFRFKGGNPNDRANWEPVTGGSGGNAGGNFRPGQ